MRTRWIGLCWVLASIGGFAGCAGLPHHATTQGVVAFTDVTRAVGLAKHLENWSVAHGAAWGDADGDGRLDLYIGAFADRPIYRSDPAPIPNMLLLNTPRGFTLSLETVVRFDGAHARTSAALFVDLDNDGDMDLLAANHGESPDMPQSTLFENQGYGRFRDVTPDTPPWPRPIGMRNVSAVDFDSDGLLDLVLTDGSYKHMREDRARLIVLRNKGHWAFEDVGERYGFPAAGTMGVGLAIGDVNDDGQLDLFVANSNRLFVSRPGLRYHECQPSTFVKPDPTHHDSHTCAAAFADLNGDGLLDLMTTEHGESARIHLYLNTGVKAGRPVFADVSEEAGLAAEFPKTGLTGLPIKVGNLALRDFDNDGRVDILLALLSQDSEGTLQPVVLRNLGSSHGIPRFSTPPLDRLLGYYCPAPVADYDRDGRMDIFLASWYPELPSALFRNVTRGGHWLGVRVEGRGDKWNRMGIGATARVYPAGHAGDGRRLIGRYDISVGNGYSSGEEAAAHFGLGDHDKCDVVVSWGGRSMHLNQVAADQWLAVEFPPVPAPP